MDIDKLIEAVRLCGSSPTIYQCEACAYYTGGDMGACIPEMTAQAADALSALRSELEQVERERNVAYKLLGGEPPKTCKTCVLWGGETDGDNTKLGTVKEMTTRMGRMIFVPGIAGRRRRDERWPSKIIHPGWTCTRAWERYRVHSPNTEPVKS